MSYNAAAEHPLTYAAVGVSILFILGFVLVVLIRAIRQARSLGYTKTQLWRITQISVSCALIPAITVLIGFLLLAPILGIPLSWWRLSIVGNTAYEIMAANIALNTTGVATTGAAQPATSSDFILVMYVMAVGIMGGMILAPLLARRVHRGILKIRQKDPRWGALGGSTYLATILIVFSVPLLLKPSIALLTLLTAAALMFLLRWLTERFRLPQLSGFAFTISTFLAIVLSALWAGLIL
ncbi:MAG: DUF5058 family protein [Coriobacteriales bacterium]|jgi:hypothetical protein|nr:DUF5058 family protein [Coriobacteriales bacterium]